MHKRVYLSWSSGKDSAWALGERIAVVPGEVVEREGSDYADPLPA